MLYRDLNKLLVLVLRRCSQVLQSRQTFYSLREMIRFQTLMKTIIKCFKEIRCIVCPKKISQNTSFHTGSNSASCESCLVSLHSFLYACLQKRHDFLLPDRTFWKADFMLIERFSYGEKIIHEFIFVCELGENRNHFSTNLLDKT